ncbi:MAG: hypothetical protein HQL03_04970 [Nitrospirae bacterium]|nr:hypothetical protein [Nitrospirota bacterium]
MHRLVYSSVAEKEIDALDNHIFLRVDDAINSLKENPFPQEKKERGGSAPL